MTLRTFVGLRRTGVLVALVALVLAHWALPGRADATFQLGITPAQPLATPAAPGFSKLRYLDASTIRINVDWSSVAPAGARAPAGFNPAAPSDRHYDWAPIDAQVRAASQNGLRVMLMLFRAPRWAEGPNLPPPTTRAGRDLHPGAWDPNPTQFAAFAHAAAVRYGGAFRDPQAHGSVLPRVNEWQAWNEPNLPWYFAAPHPIDAFRTLLNRFYGAVKAVHRDNVVIIGGGAPVSFLPTSIGPFDFDAGLLCLRRIGAGRRVAPNGCAQRARFDVLDHHPYSLEATPTTHAYYAHDVLIADMGALAKLIGTAERLHTIAPTGAQHRLWVTEFAWFTKPPNHTAVGISPRLAGRYTALSLYLMWRSGVNLVIWQTISDIPQASPPGGGLYTGGGRAKPSALAFRFPLYVSVTRHSAYAWGRAPVRGRTAVLLYQTRHGRRQEVAHGVTGADGVFQFHFRDTGNRVFQAAIPGTLSYPYDSTPVAPLAPIASG